MEVKRGTQVILGDSMGEMYAYYASADLCLIGGSLLPFGGQNLIEAMRLGKPVLLGPHTYNFAQVSTTAVAQCAAWRVNNPKEIGLALQALMAVPEKRLAMGAMGLAMCEAGQGASAKTLTHLADLLKR
jgi:3-deoxy-D-manno-octulosonic-acid transferase